MSSPSAGRRSICPGRRRAIPGTRIISPSGSSSGTGAAVAAGLVLGGTGSDTGGSIRGPSALCGLAGIKPTYGLSSRRGVLPLSQTLDHTGPMAWTVQDCALLLQAMAGHDPLDPASANRPVADFTADLDKGAKGLRIGVIRHFHEVDNPVSPATKQGIDDALDIFRSQGAEIRDVTLSPMMDYNAPGWLILTAEAYAVHEPWLKERFNDYGELMRDRLAFGALMQRDRLRPGAAPAPGAVPGDAGCDGRPRYPDHRIGAGRGAEDRRSAEMGDAGEAELHHAVQPDRPAGAERLHRLRRRRPAGQHADHRQAVRRGDGVPRRPCLRDWRRHGGASGRRSRPPWRPEARRPR